MHACLSLSHMRVRACLLQLVFVKPDFKKYTAASAEAFAVFRSYDERVEGASLDEAYLDVTQHCNTHGMTGEQVRLSATLCVRLLGSSSSPASCYDRQ
jgi:DNA polymerase kappa